MEFFGIYFLKPIYFILILLVFIFMFLLYKKQEKKANEFIFFDDLKEVFKIDNIFFYIKLILIWLIIVSFSLLLANPNTSNKTELVSKNWIDIVLVLDISTSMEANDLAPSRIEAAKEIINDFIRVQETNRLWLVIFAWVPFTSIPLTFDYSILEEYITKLSTDNINQSYNELSWTAIWDAILMWESLFDYTENTREKVMILVTDWEATHWVNPKIAAMNAKEKWIKIYTIWIWSKEWWEVTYYFWNFPQTQKIAPLNEESLIEISKITSSEYFRATDNYSLEKIFEYLEKLEKSDIEIEEKKLFTTNYKSFVYIILLFMFLYIILVFYKRQI